MFRGSATTGDQFAYFTPDDSSSLFRYTWSTEKWEKFSSPYCDPGLVIIDGELTVVGGGVGLRLTKNLFTLQHGKWFEHYPPMNTARDSPAVVCTSDSNYMTVIGGGVNTHWTATVELFHVRSRRWYELNNLPQTLSRPSATICGNEVYVIGVGIGYSCSLQALPFSDQPIISSNILTWTPLPELPVGCSTAATLCGQLVIVGGRQPSGSLVNSIHQLIDGQWVEIGSMSSARGFCLVVSASPNKLMIVGGDINATGNLSSFEECVV